MPSTIILKTEKDNIEIDLNDTKTARRVLESLPFSSSCNRWGDEIYFSIPVESELEEDAAEIIEVGDVAYWPPGKAFCIFFGPTPASTTDKPQAASPVNIIGSIKDKSDIDVLKDIRSGSEVEVRNI